MTVVCAWCQRLGRAAVIGEKEPRDVKAITHGICDEHVLVVLAEARRSTVRASMASTLDRKAS